MKKLANLMTAWSFLLCGGICMASVNPYVVHPDPQRNQLPVPTRPAPLHPNNNSNRQESPAVSECRFALSLFHELSAQNGGNVVFSPLSILTVLGALAEGAEGETALELRNATQRMSEGISMTTRQRTAQLLDQLSTNGATHHALTVANRLYLQNGFQVLPEFLQVLTSAYKMDVERVNFGMPHAMEIAINEWVSQVTNGHIGNLIPPGTLDLQTRLVLVSAIFFKGDWETAFPDSNTRLRSFNLRRGKTIQVPMMHVEGEFPYADLPNSGFEMVELPYAGRDVSMVIALPYEGRSVASVAKKLAQRPALLANPSKRTYTRSVTVYLPKFKVEASVDLKDALFGLGVRRLFEQGKADLSGITGDRELYVSDALHKVLVEVNERGTKAAAATAVVVKGRSMSNDPVFRATRPFLFFIRHNPTATLLFMGHIRQLKDASPVPN